MTVANVTNTLRQPNKVLQKLIRRANKQVAQIEVRVCVMKTDATQKNRSD